ncbi:MAG TPA: branched-chain amino acid ABC transporter permease, partial [Microbacterium sp.]|nr:branched-chain amino acid ABC transporter permease [Microbacterium sp.]
LRRRQAIAVGVAAAVVAAALTPALMPGLPVLVAAVVAIIVGWFNWLGARDGAALRQAQGPEGWQGPEGLP